MTTAYRHEPGTIPEWTLGWRLQRSLAHAELSVQQMANELGVTRSTLSRWLNDHGHEPRLSYIRRWALITGVPLSWLVAEEAPDGGDDPSEPRPTSVRVKSGCIETPGRRLVAVAGPVAA